MVNLLTILMKKRINGYMRLSVEHIYNALNEWINYVERVEMHLDPRTDEAIGLLQVH